MRTLTLLFSLIVTFPFVLSAQTAGELLQKVSAALSEGQEWFMLCCVCFSRAIAAGADQTEMYYWTQIEKNSAVAPRLVNELATYYKRKRNYDKAYLFYREFLLSIPKMFLHLCRVRNGDDSTRQSPRSDAEFVDFLQHFFFQIS